MGAVGSGEDDAGVGGDRVGLAGGEGMGLGGVAEATSGSSGSVTVVEEPVSESSASELLDSESELTTLKALQRYDFKV